MADTDKRQQGVNRQPGRPKSNTARKSGASPGKGNGAAKKRKKKQDTEFMRAEVVIICSFAVAILLFLSNFKLCGVVGDVLREFQLGIFGMAGYIMPILIFVGTCFYLSNQGNIHAALKMAAVVGALLTICGLLQLLFGTIPQGAHFSEYYKQSASNGIGGGWLGGALASLLVTGVGTAGAFLVLMVLLIICMVCITERSFVSVVKRGGGKAYQYAREDMDRRREIHAQKTEERRRLKEEQKVRGVNLDATRLTAPEEEYDEEVFDQEFGTDLEQIPVENPGGDAKDRAAAAMAASPASEFRGRFDPPLEQLRPLEPDMDVMDDAGALARSIEGFNRGSGAGSTAGSVPEHEYGIGDMEEYETIHVRRDSRTLEEMDMAGERGSDGASWDEVPWDDDRRRDNLPGRRGTPYAGIPNQEGAMPRSGSMLQDGGAPGDSELSGPEEGAYGEETIYMGSPVLESQPVESENLLRDQDTLHMENSVLVHGPAHIESLIREGESGGEVLSRDEGTDGAGGSFCQSEEDPDPYAGDEPEQGSNYDSVIVAEEPKRVVTAGGKVIETDTELLQKKIEKKKEAVAVKDADAAVAQEIKKKEEAIQKEYIFPPTRLLIKGMKNAGAFSGDEYKATAIKLQQTLHNFGVGVTVTNISCGPAVTRYELAPEQGVKVSRIVGLADDIKLSLAAADIRIEAPIPGKSAVGIEVPNKENNLVYLRELLESDNFRNHKSRLAFAVGKDIGGQVVVTDIGKMPHLLIAGATGSGKSVCINTLIMSIIFKSKPEDVKLIMVDPKVVELSVYNGIPHLLIPVVTDPKKASGALNWAVAEMTDRYQKFAQCNVRDLKGYNERVEKLNDIEDENKPQKLPQIVIIIDELADLMMVAPGEVEDSVCRLAQLARAAGIHLVIATQRPSVNVITGLIKANVPSRIAFAVSSGVDSRTIIDMNGAEKLLGKGDMLFYPSGFPKPQRVQGAFVSDEEVGNVVGFLTEQGMVAQYSKEVESRVASPAAAGGSSDRDEYFVQAGQFIIEKEKASIGMLQRMFKIGFNRAARIMDQLAEAGVVGEEEGTKPRKVLMSMEEFEELLEQGG